MPGCKIGDMAVVIDKDPDEPPHYSEIGRLVRVVARGGDYTQYGDSRLHWECEAVDMKPIWAEDPGSPDLWEHVDGAVDFPDQYLQPIRPPGVSKSTAQPRELEHT